MVSTQTPARAASALAERDRNVVANHPASDATVAHDLSSSPIKHALSDPPSKAAAEARRARLSQLSNASRESAFTPAKDESLPVASTVTFSEDAHAGLRTPTGDAPTSTSKQLLLLGSYTHTLIIGRSKPSGKPHISSAAPSGAANANSAATQTDALVIAEVEALQRQSPSPGLKSSSSTPHGTSAKYMRVCLPNDARHVSRVHALLHYSPFPSTKFSKSNASTSPHKIPTAMLGTFLLRIVGQNGLYVDGQRLRAETVVTLVPGQTTLGFFSDVEAVFDVKTDAMPAHIRTRALELQSRLVPRVSGSALRTGSPIKKKSKSSSPASTPMLTLVKVPARSSQSMPAASQSQHDTKSQMTKATTRLPDSLFSPPPTSSPSCESDTSSQNAVSQALRPLHASKGPAYGAMSPPQSSSPVMMPGGDIDVLSGLRKRKHGQYVAPSEEDSEFESDRDSNDSEHGSSSVGAAREMGEPASSPAAAASRRRIAEKADGSPVKRKRVAVLSSSGSSDGEDSDSGLSSASSLSDLGTPSPVRRPAGSGSASSKKVAVFQSSADAAKKMPPPPVPVRSSARPNTSSTPSSAPSTRASFPSSGTALNADPIAVARGAYLQSAARRAVGMLAPSYDLEGLLASCIVFHRTATMAASEAVRSVLSGTPGLMQGVVGPRDSVVDRSSGGSPVTLGEGKTVRCFSFEHALANTPLHAGRKIVITAAQWNTALTKGWREQLELALRSSSAENGDASSSKNPGQRRGGPFGAIQRAGKDSAGNPLEPWYYYKAEADPDRQRASNLAGYVKPIRGALKVHKPIYWKKSAYGHNEADVGLGGGGGGGGEDEDEEGGTTGVGGTSLLSRAVANDVWGSNVDWGVGSGTAASSSDGVNNMTETQLNALSESLVASSRYGYSTRAAPDPPQATHSSSSFASSSSASAGKHAREEQDHMMDAPEGVTQGLVGRVWTETQDEEERETTWDKFGDMDWQG
ncbi:hypothetical protein V8E36_001566 [Tilletia maclaganii]